MAHRLKERFAHALIEASRNGELGRAVQRVSSHRSSDHKDNDISTIVPSRSIMQDSTSLSNEKFEAMWQKVVANSIVQEIIQAEADSLELHSAMMTPDSECWEYEADSVEEKEVDFELKFQDIVRRPFQPAPAGQSSLSTVPAALESSPYLRPIRPEGRARNARARRRRKSKRAAEDSAPVEPQELQTKSTPSRQQPTGKSKLAGDMPEWLLREAKAASEIIPTHGLVAPPLGSRVGAIPCGLRPTEDLNMYSRRVELPWKQKPKGLHRGRKHRPPWQDPNDNRSVSPAPRSLSPSRSPIRLPKLAGEQKINEWRESMVNSAMSLARSCDVPLGLLPKAGTFVL